MLSRQCGAVGVDSCVGGGRVGVWVGVGVGGETALIKGAETDGRPLRLWTAGREERGCNRLSP
jgi:hypothetical protein